MYCYHCGKKIDETKALKQSFSEKEVADINGATTVSYVCPRCGHLIHEGCEEKDKKSLASAAHAEIQRGRNSFASGMGYGLVGIIALILAIMFYRLAEKPGMNYVLQTDSPEFYVSVVLFVASVILIVTGIIYVTAGLVKRKKYQTLLSSIQNETFFQ